MVFINFLVDIFWGFLIPLHSAMRLYSSLKSSTILYYVRTKQNKKLREKIFYSCEENFFIAVGKFFYKSVPKICLCLWEKFIFIKASQRSVYVYEKKVFYKSVSKSSHWLYKFSLVSIDIMHMYLFSFYFLWWVKIRKDRRNRCYFILCEKIFFIKVSQRVAKTFTVIYSYDGFLWLTITKSRC